MRKNVLASLLVLCGSTAAIAQMTPQQNPPTTQEAPGSPVDEAMNNQTTTEPTNPSTTTEPTNPSTTTEPTTPDMNTPLRTETPDSTSAPDSRTNTPPSEVPEPQ